MRHNLFISTFLSLWILILASCNDGNDGSTGTINVRISDAPFPIDLVEEANVTISKVELRNKGGSDGGPFLTLTEEEQSFNLLELSNGVTDSLVQLEVPVGSYDLIRLFVSEASIKRLFSQKDLSLSRLEIICHCINLSLADLFEILQKQQKTVRQLTMQQEKLLVDDTKLLLVTICILNDWNFNDILRYYTLTEHELIQKLASLDKMKIIELLPGNRFKQLMHNLLGNAIKFAERSSEILVFSEAQADHMKVGIFNKGPHIPENELETVFEYCKKASNNKISGSGLGLAICHRILELHGGAIWVENVTNGVRFNFTIPDR